MLQFYQLNVFKCDKIGNGSIQMNIIVKNADQLIAYTTDQ
jgi:hypothetical protein